LQFDVSNDELEGVKRGVAKCLCFPWVRFLFFDGGILIVFCKLIIAPFTKSFTSAMAPGTRFLKTAELPKTVGKWWKIEPRAGCRCASLTKEELEAQFKSVAATKTKLQWRISQ